MYTYLFPSVIAAVGWGILPLIDRFGMQDIDRFNYTSIKLLSYGIFGLIYICINIKSVTKNIKNAQNLNLLGLKFNPIFNAIISGLVSTIALVFYYTAISNKKFPLVNVTLVAYTVPVIVLTFLSYIFLNEQINLKMIAGIVITFIGLYITMTNNKN